MCLPWSRCLLSLIPGLGTDGWQPIDASLMCYLSLSLPLSLKAMKKKKFLGEDKKIMSDHICEKIKNLNSDSVIKDIKK